MGMFDSFYAEVDGHQVELQSKHFSCVLGHYYRGDFVDGAMPGVHVFFVPIYLDKYGKQIYGEKPEGSRQKTVFIILVEGIFVEDQAHDGELDHAAILTITQQLKERWSDSARSLAFMIEALRKRQLRISVLEDRVSRVKSIIATARRLRAGESLDRRFGLVWEENKKLNAGEDPLEVIAWALEDPGARGNSLAVRIPGPCVRQANLKPGDAVEVEVTPTGDLRLHPVAAEPFDKASFLQQLAAFRASLPEAEAVVESMRQSDRY